MSKYQFDRLPTSTIRSIMGVNAPVAVKGTPAMVNDLRAASMATTPVEVTDPETGEPELIAVGQQQPIVYVTLDKQCLEALFGFRPAKQGEIARFKTKGGDGKTVGYVADWNHSNRPHILSNHQLLKAAILGGRYLTTPEVWIFLDDGQCGSAQHRGWANYEQCLANPAHTVTVALSMGFSSHLADVLDRAAKRTNKDIISRNNYFDDSWFVDADGHPLSNGAEIMSTLARELNTTCRIVSLRGQAKDVKASGQFSPQELGDMIERMPEVPKLLADIYLQGVDATGKTATPVATFGRANIAAALILSANVDNPSEVSVTEKGKREYKLPDALFLPDPELVEGFMSVLTRTDTDSPFAQVLSKWKGASNKHPQRKFGVLIGLLEEFLATRVERENPVPVDEATGQPIPGAEPTSQWDCAPVQFDRIDPGVPKGSKDAPYKWSAFGGLDCGYQTT